MIVSPAEWKQRVCFGGCIVHPVAELCGGPLQSHHVITQQALRKHGLSDRAWDIRNGVCVCERAHARHTKAVERIPFERLPAAALTFADECGLAWQIDRYYPRTLVLADVEPYDGRHVDVVLAEQGETEPRA